MSSFEAFFDQEFERVRRVASALTADGADADALTLDAFVRARRQWRRIRHDEDPALSVRAELASLWLSPRRLLRRDRSVAPRVRLAEALARLEERDDWAIAQVIGCSPSTAASLRRRAAEGGVAGAEAAPAGPSEPGPRTRYEHRRRRSFQLRALALSVALAIAGATAAAAKSAPPPTSAAVLLRGPRAAPSSWTLERMALLGYTVAHPRSWIAITEGERLTLRPAAARHGEDPRSDFALTLGLGDGDYLVRSGPVRDAVRGWRYSTDREGHAYAFDLGDKQSLVASFQGRGASLGQFRKPARAILATLRRIGDARLYADDALRIVVPEGWLGRRYPDGSGVLGSQSGRLALGPEAVGAGGLAGAGLPRDWFQVQLRFLQCACGPVSPADFPDGTTTDAKPYRRESESLRGGYLIRFLIDWNRVTATASCREGCAPDALVTLEATITGGASVFDRYVDEASAIVASLRDASARESGAPPAVAVPLTA